MKRVVTIIIAVFVIGGLWAGRGIITKEQKQPFSGPTVTSANPQKPVVTLVLDDGSKISTYSGVMANNAYDALRIVVEQNKLNIVTKQYDFGIFVQQIGDKESLRDKAWIYYVNGKSADVAADKYELKNDDIVEWRYTKPAF